MLLKGLAVNLYAKVDNIVKALADKKMVKILLFSYFSPCLPLLMDHDVSLLSYKSINCHKKNMCVGFACSKLT